MRRIMIIGQPGAGKSTLARQIGERTGLPVFHIDHIHWKPGWVQREKAEKTELCKQVHRQDSWIFEGGHSTTWPERLDRCDTLIWLDIPVQTRLLRVTWRTLRNYGRSRPDLPEKCPAIFRAEFYHWIWTTRHSAKNQMADFFNKAGDDKLLFKLSNLRQVDQFLAKLDTTN